MDSDEPMDTDEPWADKSSQADEPTEFPGGEPKYWTMSPASLRDLAESTPLTTTNTLVRRQLVQQRSEAVRVYVLRRANGVCEGCGSLAPFKRRNRRPYLEPHHIYRIADGDPDHPAHVVALWPNCHRRVHHGLDGVEYNQTLADKMEMLEPR